MIVKIQRRFNNRSTIVSQSKKIIIPDIGSANKVDVIAVLIKPGQAIAVDDALATLEGDKASMDVPSTDAGIVESVSIKVGDKVSEGDVICIIKTDAKTQVVAPSSHPKIQSIVSPNSNQNPETVTTSSYLHAGPGVRRLAHEFEIDLKKLKGTGDKDRITKEDLKQYVKNKIQAAESSMGFNLPKLPIIDFNKFGETETQAFNKIKKFSGANLHRNWISIPHITQFNDADITDLENFRKLNSDKAKSMNLKLTPIVFIMKAVAAALKQFPIFNASLDASGENVILKKYFHIGVAVDTPNGLVVPVIRDVDQKNIFDLAKELSEISEKARTVGLAIKDMQGGCFTISSLGGIGGTAFTPIINAPEVAILGLSKSQLKPIYQPDGNIAPRLMLPLSLSYDHRVIDGADGARFIVYLSQCLTDKATWN